MVLYIRAFFLPHPCISLIAEKIKDLQSLFSGNDKQDYLAMTTLTMMVEILGEKHTITEQVPEPDIMNELEHLDQHIQKALLS